MQVDFEEVFEDEIEENGYLSEFEIEDVEGVTDYEDDISYNSGWYNYHEVTFKYRGKKYSFEYKSHTSDNVCDTEVLSGTFKEIEPANLKDLTLNKEWYSLEEVMYLLKLDPKAIEKLLEEIDEE